MSINTFRTHTRHIFTNLEVDTRRVAVSCAGALDLLEPDRLVYEELPSQP